MDRSAAPGSAVARRASANSATREWSRNQPPVRAFEGTGSSAPAAASADAASGRSSTSAQQLGREAAREPRSPRGTNEGRRRAPRRLRCSGSRRRSGGCPRKPRTARSGSATRRSQRPGEDEGGRPALGPFGQQPDLLFAEVDSSVHDEQLARLGDREGELVSPALPCRFPAARSCASRSAGSARVIATMRAFPGRRSSA